MTTTRERLSDPEWSSAWVYAANPVAAAAATAVLAKSEGVTSVDDPEFQTDKGQYEILAWLQRPYRHLRDEDARNLITLPGVTVDGCDHTFGVANTDEALAVLDSCVSARRLLDPPTEEDD